MKITTASAKGNEQAIIHFRRQICARIGLDPDGAFVQPLPHATYLFGYQIDDGEPVGMIEFFHYNHAFRSFADSPYGKAANLEAFGSLEQLAHVRSLIIEEAHQRSRLFKFLCASMCVVAHRQGARYMTAGTGAHNQDILAIHRSAGMHEVGRYTMDGAEQILNILELEPMVQRVANMRNTSFLP